MSVPSINRKLDTLILYIPSNPPRSLCKNKRARSIKLSFALNVVIETALRFNLTWPDRHQLWHLFSSCRRAGGKSGREEANCSRAANFRQDPIKESWKRNSHFSSLLSSPIPLLPPPPPPRPLPRSCDSQASRPRTNWIDIRTSLSAVAFPVSRSSNSSWNFRCGAEEIYANGNQAIYFQPPENLRPDNLFDRRTIIVRIAI